MTALSANLLSQTKPAPICSSTRTIRCTGWPGATPPSPKLRTENKPIILSVGYAACHWCHVMAHESFEDDETAQLMNEHFVAIKVDREERPDVDRLYMQALHSLGEQGGWPLTMFLTPDGHPFWGGTYFPKESALWPAELPLCAERARPHLARRTRQGHRPMLQGDPLGAQNREPQAPSTEQASSLARSRPGGGSRSFYGAIDLNHGGLKGAPKFPQVLTSSPFCGRWRSAAGNPRLAEAVTTTLTHICQGGIYDHLGGGFARYSVDAAMARPAFREDAL